MADAVGDVTVSVGTPITYTVVPQDDGKDFFKGNVPLAISRSVVEVDAPPTLPGDENIVVIEELIVP
jgi:hypothetical protein